MFVMMISAYALVAELTRMNLNASNHAIAIPTLARRMYHHV
jgi:flagellar basal body rod protein FlgC